MKISFLGAVRSVTGSMHTIETNGTKILLDCGLFQGRRDEARTKNRNLPFDESSIDAMILSHAHIDHSGNIPNFVKNGYGGPIYATEATRDLCESMLPDSGYIQEKDVEYLNKRLLKKGELPLEPIYTKDDAVASMENIVAKQYDKTFDVTENIQATFYNAGHILGSALTKITIKDDGRLFNIGYIVDLGRKNMPILKNPVIIKDLDYIIIESTYGGRIHENIEFAQEKLRQIIQRTYDRGGKIIIPSFALERTQEIVYHLNNLWNAKKLPEIPVYVDSPLAVNVTSVFKRHPECYDDTTKAILEYDDDPFGFEKLHYVRDVNDSKRINEKNEPCIIISASGMCETGRILHHLKNNIENPNNTILIVGFMAQNTLGRKLIDKVPKVKIFGDTYTVNAEVIKMNAFSAHAGQDELQNYVTQANQKLKGVFLVHGEESQMYQLENLLKESGIENVIAPEPEEVVEL